MKLSSIVTTLCAGYVGQCFAGDQLTQIATIESLMEGVYEGHFECSEVLKFGNLGLGTFDSLDGEMIVLDGQMYKANSEGDVVPPTEGEKTPFAVVVDFESDQSISLSGISTYDAVQAELQSQLPSPNLLYAIRAHGVFSSIRVRSPRKQERPYGDLPTVLKTQSEFEGKELTGTLVGFIFPKYLTGVNVPGFHLHFISDDHQFAGHVLELAVGQVEVEVDHCYDLLLKLPHDSASFSGISLGGKGGSIDKLIDQVEK